MKKAVCVISLGTTRLDAVERCIVPLENYIKDKYGNHTFFRAFCSKGVIAQLRKKNINNILHSEDVLDYLAENQYESVHIVPTHIFNGIEYKELSFFVERLKKRYSSMKISLGRPLIETKADVTQIVKILENDYIWLEKDEAVVFMGHEIIEDTTDFSSCVRETIHQENQSFYYVTNKKEDAEINTLNITLKKQGISTIYLQPLMLTTGMHAEKDLAGEDSWKSILSNLGYNTHIVLKGLGEYTKIVEMYGKKSE